MVKQKETQVEVRITPDKCVEMGLHNTDYVISAFEGKLCKRCLRK